MTEPGSATWETAWVSVASLQSGVRSGAAPPPPRRGEERPGGLEAPEPERALEPERAHAQLLVRHVPDRGEPRLQREVGALKDRARSHRGLLATGGAAPERP